MNVNVGHSPFYIEESRSDQKSFFVTKKLGGDNAKLLKDNARIIKQESELGIAQAIVVSAIRDGDVDFNTTSTLENMGKNLVIGNMQKVLSDLEDIKLLHVNVIKKQFGDDVEFITRFLKNLDQRFLDFEGKLEKYDESIVPCKQNDYTFGVSGGQAYSFLELGEALSQEALVEVLREEGVNAVAVDTSNALNASNNENPSITMIKFFQNEITNILEKDPRAVPVVAGFFGNSVNGILDLYGRGYTDATALLVTLAMEKSGMFDETIFNIQKMEEGFKTTDPRKLKNREAAQTLKKISYELTDIAIKKEGANAGLINENALTNQLRKANIRMLVNNPHLQVGGTIIDKAGDQAANGVDLVLSRELDLQLFSDIKRFGKRVESIVDGGEVVNKEHILYLLGENFKNIGEVHAQVLDYLKFHGVTPVGGYADYNGKNGVSLVFSSLGDTKIAQNLLHELLIENKVQKAQVA